MSENEERKEKRKKEKKDKKHKKEKKEKRDKTDVKEEDGETKAEGKAKKGRERKSRVSFLHERQTAPPPPRYSVGEEPPLPAFPITWSPIAVCVETSLPVFSRDALMDVLNAVGRPAMSMSVVHPLDLAEDEMRVEGTQLAAELVTAKIEGKRSWPPPDLLTKCLRSRSLLDRDKEHRLEELRRANLVLESRKATEDASAAVRAAAEGVKAAETLLKEYRAKLKEDRIKEVTAKRLAARAAKESEAAAEAAQKAETIIGGKKPKKDKKEKKEKEEKGLKDDNEKKEDKKEKKEKSKGKKGKGRDEDASVILLTPQEQWKLLEDGIAKAKAAVFEAEVQVEVCLENEAKVESTLNDPFKTGHVYCMLGLDSALPIAELCAEKNSFFRGVLNVSLKPKVPLILPESSGPNTPRDDDALSVASTSSVSSSKSADSKKRRKSRKEAKAAAKAAKVEAAVSAIPLLVSEIRSLKEACAVTDVLRRVAVLDVFYEPAPPLELDFFPELESMDQDRNYKKGMTQEGIEGEKEPKEKKKKEKNKKKADTEEKTGDGVEKKEKKEKKGKESKEGRKSKRGDIALPYKEIAQAIVAACQRLQVQVDLYNQMGGDTVRVFTVPAAKPLEEVDTSYYKRLISEVPRGLVSVPIIVHCLVEQVAAYSWPVQDIKAFEVANENTQLLRGMEEAFKKLGHPRWIGVDRDISSSLAKRFEMLYNFSQKDAAQSLIPDTGNQPESETDIKDTGRMPAPDPRETGSLNKEEVISKKSKEGSPTNDQATSAVKSKFSSRQPSKLETGGTNSGKDDSSAKKDDGDPVSDVKSPPEDESKESETIAGDMHVSADCGDCIMHEVGTGTCPVHHDHLDTDDAVELRKPEKREPPYDSLANPKDLEEHLNVTHEFDTVRRMLLTLIPHRQQFTSSVDVGKVEEHMSKIRATPGRGRRKMPVQPELSEEKMGAALTALQDLCEKYEEPRFPVGDKEAEFHCAEHLAGHPPSYGVPVQTVQRYKKLNTFFEMIKEDKLMLPDFDVPVKEPPKAPDLSPVDLVDSPDFSPHQIKDWCEICKRIFSQPGMRAKLPKFIEPPPERPSIRHRLSILERKKSLLEIIQEKKKSLTVDQDMFGSDTNISVALVDESDTGQEEQKLETDSPTLEELEHAERHYDTNPGLDSEKVKTWCPVCARIFAVPTPPDLQEIWKEGERMRLEMERLAQENEQAIIAAKIAAWERKKETLRQSIIGRRHAEGFADGVMGEVYARAKLLLPFELLRYDREEDCVLSILYAADGERTFYEEIPIYVPFGEFCLGDIDKIGPIKRLREAYELETRFRSIQDKRRYLLTEDGGLVVCGLPAMSLVQYEPRTTVIKDGIIVTLRAPEISCEKTPKRQEETKVDDGSPPKQVEEAPKSKKRKGGSRSSSPKPVKVDEKEPTSDDDVPPGKEGKRKVKTKKKIKVEEQDTNTRAGPASGGSGADSLIAEPVPTLEYTSGPSSSEKQRTVMASLVDGVIVCFFFGKDGTLSLQVNNPSGRTFELTSSGVVAFLPVESEEDEPPRTSVTSPPPLDVYPVGGLSLMQEEGIDGKPKMKGKDTLDRKSRKKGKDASDRSSSPEKEGDRAGKSRKKGDNAEGSLGKEGDKGEKERKKTTGDSKDEKAAKESEQGKKSKKKKSEKEEASKEVESEKSAFTLDVTTHLTCDLQFLTKVYEDKQGGREISRCVLPTGSVVSYKRNGQMQILLKDGNVSEYTAVPDKAALSKIPGVEKTSSDGNSLPNKANEFNFGWHTTNNKGLAAMKLPVPYIDPSKPESSPRGEGEERSSEEKKGKESEGKGGKGKDKGEGKEKEEGTGKEEGKGDRKQKEKMKASKDKAGKGETKLIDSPPERPATPFSDEEVDSGALKRTLEVPIPVDSVPHIEMPSKKVIEIYDPDTGSSILTREDLVVIVRTDDQSVRVVQHADGTHIYSEISDVSSSGYKPSAGQCMMDDVKRFNANATLATLCTASSRKYSELPANEADKIHMLGGISGKPSVPLKASSTMDVTSPDNKRSKDLTGKREVKSGPLSTPPVSAAPVSSEKTSVAGTQIDAVGAPRVNDVTGTVPHVAEPDKSQEFFTVKWHVRKDGFPNVQGNTKGGVAVDFCTVEGQYCATWSKESGQLSLLMPNGSMLYSCGKLVFFDPSDGSKKADPQQSLHDQVTEGRSFVNTNGLYEFNLEKASLSYTDNAGNGFRTSWGFKIDAIVSGKVPEPPPQAKVGCGIEGPVGIDKPVGQLDFTSQDDPLSSGTTEVYSKTSFSKVGPKDQPAGSMTGPDSRSPSGKKDMRVPPLKSDRKGDASQASKHRMPASGTLEVVQVLPSSSIPMEQNNLEEDSLVSVRDPGPASDISTASRPASVDGSQNEVPEEPYLGPYPRLFVIHEGGFGFEILHEDDLEKYAYSKVFKKECTRVMENYAKSDVVMHTFVTVEQKAKKLAELDVEKHEGCRAPDGLKLWTKKIPEFARRIKFRAVLSKMQKRTKCDWLQLGLELPFLPRAVAPEMLPVMPLSNVTYIMFRQIFEYASFESGQIRKMDKILEAYGEWQDSSMILTDVEVIPDQRTPQEKKKAEDIALRIREGVAEQKLQEARERAAIEVQHAAQVLRMLREKEMESQEEFERLKRGVQAESLRQWLLYKESKSGRIPCKHKCYHLLQEKPPFRPGPNQALLYFHCEEGLEFMYRLNFYRRPPTGPSRWSVETTPPRSQQGLEIFAQPESRLGPEVEERVYELSERQAWQEEVEGQNAKPETWIFEQRMQESRWKPEPEDSEQVEEAKEDKEVYPYLFAGDENEEYIDRNLLSNEELLGRWTHEPEPEEEETLPALPDLPSFWQAPVGTDWQINNEAVQYQMELLPNRPGWVKAEWRENKDYLEMNLPTMRNMQISSVAQLKLLKNPPKDWDHQFLLVPQRLDFGTVEYGTISMKVAFLQNYHGTNCGRFRFEDLGRCCRILCEYGMVPPGLYRILRVFFRADRLGIFENQIKVLTQYDIFTFPIYANVVRPKAFDESKK